MEFILEEIPWKSVAGTSRGSALDHKITDDPVENGLREEWFGDNRSGGKVDPLAGSFCEGNEIGDCFRGAFMFKSHKPSEIIGFELRVDTWLSRVIRVSGKWEKQGNEGKNKTCDNWESSMILMKEFPEHKNS